MADKLMESRGQKRSEIVEQLPADKRACSSLEFKPSSSSVTPQTFVNFTNSASETHEGDMETSSSSHSASGRSEGDGERESPYGSCDSDDMNDGDHQYRSLREFQRSRSYGDNTKFTRVLSSLSNEADKSIAALTELCELLSFCTEDSISSTLADQLAPLLVKLAKLEENPDIMLLAIRALTYLCDVFPRSSGFLVRHDAIPTLCQRLMVIEYLDVAEQCLQALEKISRDQPLVCLQSGAIAAVLGYIDFFSTSVQRTALSTVVNICKKLPSECPSPFMEAVPRLINLLQYEDQQLVELVATCLIKIADRVKDSPEMLTQLYEQGLIHQVTRLLDLNSRITLSKPTYTGLVGLVAKLASRSAEAIRTLFELNIGSILKDVLCNSDLAHGLPSPRALDKNCNQVHETLILLHELLPEIVSDQKEELLSSKERFLLEQPDRLQKFGMDILPTLIQVVSSGANLHVCYGCLSAISKLVYFSKPGTLHEMVKDVNIASFLAGLFTRNDHHILLLALKIAQTVLEKLSNTLMQSFIKEGVLFAIDTLLMSDSRSSFTFPVSDGIQSEKIAGRDTRCLCYAYISSHSESTSDSQTCKVDNGSVHNLAEHIKTKFFAIELNNSQSTVTDVLQDLRNASEAITVLLNTVPSGEKSVQNEDILCSILHQVTLKLGGNEPISTFELLESGIIKALLKYLSNGQYLSRSFNTPDILAHNYGEQKRFETFARISLSPHDPVSKDLPLSLLVRKLQSALSSVETFPVIVGYSTKQRGSYATVPSGCYTKYPCFKVRFVRGEEEQSLSDYSVDGVTVDPFCLVEEIEKFLRPKVSQEKMESSQSKAQTSSLAKTTPIQAPLDAAILPETSTEQEQLDGTSHCTPMEISDLGLTTAGETKATSEVQSGFSEEEIHSSDSKVNLKSECAQNASSSTCIFGDEEDGKKKLALYLEGERLDYSSTLYQEILQRHMKSQNELHNGVKLWSDTYTVTYKRAPGIETTSHKQMPVFSGIFMHTLGSSLDPSSPTSDILFLLRSLEMMNKCTYHLMSYERMNAFSEGKIDNLDNLKVSIPTLLQYEFVNSRLTEKLEQQMRDPSIVHVGAMPLWCSQLMARCPFLFSFEARCKYFQLAAFGRLHILPSQSSRSDSDVSGDRRSTSGGLPRKKFLVCRESVLKSATQMMDLYASKKVSVEVEYNEEVGFGLGPTLEFYTLVSHEFQKASLGMWRGDYMSPTSSYGQQGSSSGLIISTSGLFPRPWSPTSSNINGTEFSDVIMKFTLLGQTVGKALQDGRVLDIPFSKAFYKLVLGKELFLCDIQSFDLELGRTLMEFQALVNRRKRMELTCRENIEALSSGFRNRKIEDLCLDFTLPGYPDYILASKMDDMMVNDENLEEYISLVFDATLHTGISRQVEAFKSGLNQVLADKHLHLFNEEELERLLCGENDSWVSADLLDHIKFDHGYTASSLPIINLLEIISEFNYEQRRAFLQFVTGAPRLSPGGLASLNPKMTIVRKHSSNAVDADLPSVMTCANYLKLPPYSSKEKMKEKVLYAITEGQGSFHLS